MFFGGLVCVCLWGGGAGVSEKAGRRPGRSAGGVEESWGRIGRRHGARPPCDARLVVDRLAELK
jgi:hypothetical protein